LGPAAAAVEIVAFGDLQSPDYGRLAQAYGSVRETFGDRVRLVFKHLPVLGPESLTAAQAAHCARAQQKFWPYHDAMLAQAGTLATRLEQSAKAAGVDRKTLEACIAGDDSRAAIRQALEEAGRYDIRTSPSFLVNGRLAPPPPPFLGAFDYFKRLVEEELGSVARSR
jgi:protein-disulfide isomerase